jgi:hypothetical protein
LRKKPRIKTELYVQFDELLVKGRAARGVLLTKHKIASVRPISQKVYCQRLGVLPENLPADRQPEKVDREPADPDASTSNSNTAPVEDRPSDEPSSQKDLFK